MKKILAITVLATFNLMLFGQFHPLENYPTPNAASLGEFGNIPVNMFSGTPIVSIPLYEVREGNISVPISLNYNLASVKPNIHPGWVGLGWHLSAGGAITRTVRGTYDEHMSAHNNRQFGFYSNEARAALRSVNNSAGLGLYGSAFLGHSNPRPSAPTFELMTDEYNFNFGQYSGSFYLCAYRGWVVVSDHDIKVEFNPETGFRYLRHSDHFIRGINTMIWNEDNKRDNHRFFDVFTLITPDGKRYTFGGGENGRYAVEYSISYYTRHRSSLIPTTWFLTKIESPEGYKVEFKYEAKNPIAEIGLAAYFHSGVIFRRIPRLVGSGVRVVSCNEGVTFKNNYQKLVGYLMFPVYLKQITSSHTTVDFHTSEASEMLLPEEFVSWTWHYEYNYPPKICPFSFAADYYIYGHLNAFTTLSPLPDGRFDQNLKWFILDSIGIKSSLNKTFVLEYNDDSEIETSRRRLIRVAEQAGDEVIAYRFKYNTTETFSPYLFANIDHWGFYRGGERGTSNEIFNFFNYELKNATNDPNIAQAETLREIIYPTGGRTVFTYEQNTWSRIVPADRTHELIVENGRGGGLRVSKIENYDVDDKLLQTKRFYYTEDISTPNNSSGILKAKKIYVANYDIDEPDLQHNPLRLTGNIQIASESGFMATGTNQSDPIVGYSSVIVRTIDGQGNSIGYVRYRYTNHHSHRDENYRYAHNNSLGICYSIPVTSRSMERGKIVLEEYFDANNNPIKSIRYKYTRINPGEIKAPGQQRIPFFIPWRHNSINDDDIFHCLTFYTSYFAFMNYIYTHRYFVSEIIETDFDTNTGKELTTTKRFTYNNSRLLTSEEITNSDGKIQRTQYIYPFEITSGPLSGISQQMTNRHVLSNYVHKISFVDNMVVGGETRTFNNVGTAAAPIYRPEQIQVLRLNNPIAESQLYRTNVERMAFGISSNPYSLPYYPQDYFSQEIYIFSPTRITMEMSFHEKNIFDYTNLIYYTLEILKTHNNESVFKEEWSALEYTCTGYCWMSSVFFFTDLLPGIYRVELKRHVREEYAPPSPPPGIDYQVSIFCEMRPTPHMAHSAFRPEISYRYDNKGNVIETRLIESNVTTSYFWGYAQQYPIIEVRGKTRQQIESALSGADIGFYQQMSSGNAENDVMIRSFGEMLRQNLPDAFVTTYTHIPRVGISSITDSRGITTYYNYDAFGRLREVYLIENGQKQILQVYEYQYRQF